MKGFALFYGVVFLLIGIMGMIPGITPPHEDPNMVVQTGLGLAMGLFPVNVIHNVVHVVFGVWGLAASRTYTAARGYARAVAVIYALLAVMGLIGAAGINTTFGLVPLYGHDVWLHALLAAGAAYFGFARRDQEVPSAA